MNPDDQLQDALQAILHATTDGIIVTDADGCIWLLNQPARFLFARRTNDVIGVPLAEAPLDAALRSRISQVLEMERAHPAGTTTLFDATLDNGRTCSLSITALNHGAGYGWVVVARDIRRLQEAEQQRMDFVRSAAHDLRNPLSVTLSTLVLLREELEPANNPMVLDLFDIALSALTRLHALLEDAVGLEALQTGSEFDSSGVRRAIAPILSAAVHATGATTGSSGQSIHVDLVEPLPDAAVDAAWLQRAVENLLLNASERSGEGGQIALRGFVQGDELIIEVEDDGPAIPPELQSRLFDRFFRLPPGLDDLKGGGLGLALVRAVAEAHHGRVFIRCNSTQGAAFGLALPAG